MRKKIAWLLVALALLPAGCGRRATAVPGEPDPVPVRLAEVVTGPISEGLSFAGEVAAGSEVQVVPKVAGRVKRVAASVGQAVKKGDLLVELEAEELAAALRQAEAAAEVARANLQSARLGGALLQLRAAAEQSRANYLNAKSTLERMEVLYAEGAVSLQQLEAARLQHQVAQSQYSLAVQQLESFERGEGQVAVLEAQVKQAEAALELARLNYSNSRITAPVDGVVAALSAEAGNMVSPGMPVAVLVDLEGATVTARLTEQAARVLFVGMAVTVQAPDLGESFAGEVKEVAPAPVAGARAFPVKVRVFAASRLRPGMFVRLHVNVAGREDALLVPRAALLEQDGSYHVFTVKDGAAVKRKVAVGLLSEQHGEIKSGLEAGERIVVAGQHFLRDGSPVLVEEGVEQ